MLQKGDGRCGGKWTSTYKEVKQMTKAGKGCRKCKKDVKKLIRKLDRRIEEIRNTGCNVKCKIYIACYTLFCSILNGYFHKLAKGSVV